MSQSMGWVENLIFACGPLGIITTMVGAFRVAGEELYRLSSVMRESRGAVEVELMSSISADVWELWNGQGVVRVLGSSPIIELYYQQGDPGNTSNSDAMDGDVISLIEHGRKDMGIWGFESAISTGLLENGNSPESDSAASPEGPSTRKVVPNIGLNLSGQRVPNLEFMLVALAGIVLQARVMVFAGVGVYLSPWDERFEKKRQPGSEALISINGQWNGGFGRWDVPLLLYCRTKHYRKRLGHRWAEQASSESCERRRSQ